MYIISKIFFDKLNLEDTKQAIQNTFNYRNTSNDFSSIIEVLKDISNNQIQQQLWNRYSKSHYFAISISFSDVIESVTNLVKKIYDQK